MKEAGERNQGNSQSIKTEEMSVLISCDGRPLIHSLTLKAISQAHSEKGGPGRDFSDKQLLRRHPVTMRRAAPTGQVNRMSPAGETELQRNLRHKCARTGKLF